MRGPLVGEIDTVLKVLEEHTTMLPNKNRLAKPLRVRITSAGRGSAERIESLTAQL